MRVRYKPICCGDEDGFKNYPLYCREIYHRYLNIIIPVLSVIILALLYLSGIFTYLFEEDFTNYSYPSGTVNVKDLVDKIDSLQGPNRQFPNRGADLVNKALETIQVEDERFKNIVPLNQFKDLHFPIDVSPSCLQQWPQAISSQQQQLITVIIVVKSAVNNYARRNAIRNSWYQNHTLSLFSFKTVFVVGKCREDTKQQKIDGDQPSSKFQINSVKSWLPQYCSENILHESRAFGDIVQSSGIDAYYNNTLKTYMTLRWLNERCPSDFTLAIDDDYVFEVENFIDHLMKLASDYLPSKYLDPLNNVATTPNVLGFELDGSKLDGSSQAQKLRRHLASIELPDTALSTRSAALNPSEYQSELIALSRLSKQDLWNGYLRNYVHPLRSVLSKWYISRKEYAYNKYPPFITGGATLMSFKTIRHLYYATFFTSAFKFDDVYIGMLAYKLGINALHSENFMCTLDDYMDAKPLLANSTNCIGVHEIEPDSLIELWQARRRLLGH